MKQNFRQTQAWLHTWVGLLPGWVLYFVFITGTFGYINAELTRWMKPELPLASGEQPSATEMVALAEQRLRTNVPNATYWNINLPGGRSDGAIELFWIEPAQPGDTERRDGEESLDPRTGEPLNQNVRETGGGYTLYVMHYVLHYMPATVGEWIVGVCTMAMLVAIITGIVIHKAIFKDFFTFRPAKGKRSWLDGHNLLSVTALPFHLMITWSGLIFFLFMYMPVAVNALYPEGQPRQAFLAEAYGREPRTREASSSEITPTVELAPLVSQANHIWGEELAYRVNVRSPNRADAKVEVDAPFAAPESNRKMVRFNGATGELLDAGEVDTRTPPGWFNDLMLKLHEGKFSGPFLRLLYVITGFVGAAMIATGLMLWASKRRAKAKPGRAPQKVHAGVATVEVLNLGTIIGLPIGIALYLWANRLLPVGMENRGDWEVHVMFITWGLTFIYSIWRPIARAWVELCLMAAAAWSLLPILNAITTDKHLGNTIPAGDGVLVSLDLGMLVAGLVFGFMAWIIRRKQLADVGQPVRVKAPITTETHIKPEITAEASR